MIEMQSHGPHNLYSAGSLLYEYRFDATYKIKPLKLPPKTYTLSYPFKPHIKIILNYDDTDHVIRPPPFPDNLPRRELRPILTSRSSPSSLSAYTKKIKTYSTSSLSSLSSILRIVRITTAIFIILPLTMTKKNTREDHLRPQSQLLTFS
jgi:hypothetical protein